jgi:metal-responsive CopG/Arc/MetJ family transcriptional regulator
MKFKKKPLKQHFTVTVSQSLFDKLKDLSETHGLPRSQVVEQLIEKGLKGLI